MAGVLIRRGEETETDIDREESAMRRHSTHRKNIMWQLRQRLEWYVFRSGNTQDCQQCQGARRGAGNRFCPGAFTDNMALLVS